MNLDETKKELDNLTNAMYFNKLLFKSKKDDYYQRRSFDDLFLYFRKYKVSEKMLLQALYESGFCARVCSSLKKVVFFKAYIPDNKFWYTFISKGTYGYIDLNCTENTKYTREYLDNLFDKIYINTKL